MDSYTEDDEELKELQAYAEQLKFFAIEEFENQGRRLEDELAGTSTPNYEAYLERRKAVFDDVEEERKLIQHIREVMEASSSSQIARFFGQETRGPDWTEEGKGLRRPLTQAARKKKKN
jgi:hypothetical protein